MGDKVHYRETQYGFEWGAARIERLFKDDKKGWVTFGILTAKESIQVYITKTGKVRIHSHGEWTPPKKAPK